MLDMRPLRSSTFRHLAAAYWINDLGNWFGEIALAILVYDRTHSPLATATLFLALRFLPALLAPLLTVRVEVVPPRMSLPCLYVLEGGFFAGMAILAHHFSLPAILALSAIDGMLAITAKALTRGVSATWLLKRELLREGNAILNLGTMVSTAAGPALSGVAVAWKGPGTSLIVDAVTFVVTAGAIATARGMELETDHEAGFRGRIRAGARVLRDYTAVRRLLVGIAFVFLLGSIPVPIEVVFAKQTLHAGDRGYGFLIGAWGAGMVVGGRGLCGGTSGPADARARDRHGSGDRRVCGTCDLTDARGRLPLLGARRKRQRGRLGRRRDRAAGADPDLDTERGHGRARGDQPGDAGGRVRRRRRDHRRKLTTRRLRDLSRGGRMRRHRRRDAPNRSCTALTGSSGSRARSRYR